MNCRLILILVVLVSFTAYGQYSLKGTVRCYNNKNEIVACSVISDPYVTIALENAKLPLFSKEREPVKGTSTNRKGEFQLDSIPVSKVSLLLHDIGYERMVIENIPLDKHRTVDLGDIYILKVSTVSGMNNHHEGVIANRNNKVNTIVSLDYPPSGKKINVKVEKDCIYFDYKELIDCR